MKFLRIEKSLMSSENVVLTIVNRSEGATLLNVDECHGIEVCAADLVGMPDGYVLLDERELRSFEAAADRDADILDAYEVSYGTIQGL